MAVNKIRGRTIRAQSRKSFLRNVNLPGTARIEAAAGGKVKGGLEGERLVLMANSGRPMDLEGFFDPVIIDLDGATFDKKRTPILADHNTALRIGHSTDQIILKKGERGTLNGSEVKGPLIAATGIRSSKSRVARSIVEDMKNEFPFQVSVGAKIDDGYLVEAGDTATVNGKRWKGPLIVASKTRIRELTVTVLGADNDTSSRIAAKTHLKEKLVNKQFKAYVRKMGFDPNSLTDKQKVSLMASFKAQAKSTKSGGTATATKTKKIKASATPTATKTKRIKARDDNKRQSVIDERAERRKIQAKETLRIDAIDKIAAKFQGVKGFRIKLGDKKLSVAEVQAHAIQKGWSAERFELECHRAEYPKQSGPAIHRRDGRLEAKALECAILRSAAVPMTGTNPKTGKDFGIESMYPEEVLEASEENKYTSRCNTLEDLLDVQIRAAGRIPTSRSGNELMAQAHEVWMGIKNLRASTASVLNLVNIFENVMHKATLSGFNEEEGVWRQVCAVRSLNDFRPHNLYRLDHSGAYRKIGPDGELKHVGMVDSKISMQLETYGAMITIDRKTRINNDLGSVIDKARGIGSLGAQRLEESVWVLLLSNPGSFFHANNNNLMTGAGSVLGIAALTTAKKKFRDQVVNGKPVSNGPSILIVGTTLEDTANNLYNLGKWELGYGNTDTGLVVTENPHKGKYKPVVTGYLDNTNIVDQDGSAISGQSATQSYLFARPGAPQGSAMYVGFLNGRETPFYDEAETQFNTPGGIQIRSYHDWGVAMGLEEMAIKLAGA